MLYTALIILLLLSSSFGDEGDDAKQGGKIVKNTPKLEGEETLVGGNFGGSNLEAAKDVAESKQSEISGKVKVEGDDVPGKVKVDERDGSDTSGKVKVEGGDVSRKVKVDERDEFSGKVILLYHPINTKSHRNQQNAIAEVCQSHNYH